MNKKNIFLKKLARHHLKLTSVIFVLYLILSLVIDPRFIIDDFRDKYQAIADEASISITLRVIGPPGQPQLTTQPGCSSENPYIDLSWNDTVDTDSYDIYRDSVLLVTGLTGTSYRDNGILENTEYAYRVAANGPKGTTFSQIVLENSDDCVVIVTPVCNITSIEDIDLVNFQEIPKIHDQKPTFTGTTNLSNAQVRISIIGHPSIFSLTYANINGYWTWTTPEKLDWGSHTILATATDPLDSERQASDSQAFRVTRKEKEKEKEDTKIPAVTTKPKEKSVEETLRPELFVSVLNPDRTVEAGKKLELEIRITDLPSNQNNDEKIMFEIIDKNGRSVWESAETTDLFKKHSVDYSIPISGLTPPGRYKIVAKTNYQNDTLAGEDYFVVKSVPLVTTGTVTISLLELMRGLGWLLWILVTLLLIILAMLGIEHHLSRQAIRHITENYLAKKGYISRKRRANY